MGTTIEKLTKVLETKEAIRTSINNKGGTLTESDTFSSYSTAIDNIKTGNEENPLQYIIDNQSGDGKPNCRYLFSYYDGTSLDSALSTLDTSKVTDMDGMFYGCQNLTTISLFDTSNVTNMRSMFQACWNLTTIPLLDTSNVTNMSNMFSGSYTYNNTSSSSNMKLTSIPQLDTSKVTSMDSMFYQCVNLTTIPQLNTSKVTSMGYMFDGCHNLTSIPQLNTSKVTSMSHMFYQCINLTNIPQLDTSKVTSMYNMFYYCHKLKKIDITQLASANNFAYSCYSLKILIIRTMNKIPSLSSNAFTNCYHFYGTKNSTYNSEGLKDGAIYVPDDRVEELKVATNWSVFADIIKPLSEYVEE